MDWIKKRYEQCALALLALILLACSALLIQRTQEFGGTFAEATATAVTRNKVPPLVLSTIEEAKKVLAAPPQWNDGESRLLEADKKTRKRGSLFAATRYVIDTKRNLPTDPGFVSFYNDSLTGKEIPNDWFQSNNLPLLDALVPLQDTDKDGFLNEDEWRAGTDPNKKEAHPPYHTKLFVKQFIRTPFRMVFKAHDYDPKQPEKIASASFQINTLDLRQPSEFLKIGEKVSNTKFKLEKFEYKTKSNPSTGEEDDVSVLILKNTETDELVPLVYNRITDSPNFSMEFIYKWGNLARPASFTVKKGGIFVLQPNIKPKTDEYKLIDSKEGKAQIKTPEGESVEILPDPRK